MPPWSTRRTFHLEHVQTLRYLLRGYLERAKCLLRDTSGLLWEAAYTKPHSRVQGSMVPGSSKFLPGTVLLNVPESIMTDWNFPVPFWNFPVLSYSMLDSEYRTRPAVTEYREKDQLCFTSHPTFSSTMGNSTSVSASKMILGQESAHNIRHAANA
jgi:hypothetical protein